MSKATIKKLLQSMPKEEIIGMGLGIYKVGAIEMICTHFICRFVSYYLTSSKKWGMIIRYLDIIVANKKLGNDKNLLSKSIKSINAYS